MPKYSIILTGELLIWCLIKRQKLEQLKLLLNQIAIGSKRVKLLKEEIETVPESERS